MFFILVSNVWYCEVMYISYVTYLTENDNQLENNLMKINGQVYSYNGDKEKSTYFSSSLLFIIIFFFHRRWKCLYFNIYLYIWKFMTSRIRHLSFPVQHFAPGCIVMALRIVTRGGETHVDMIWSENKKTHVYYIYNIILYTKRTLAQILRVSSTHRNKTKMSYTHICPDICLVYKL